MRTVPEDVLMDRAALAVADTAHGELEQAGIHARDALVALLVGPGLNGGDALLAGAELARRGARVHAVLMAPRAHERGLHQLREAGGITVSAGSEDELAAAERCLTSAHLVIDGIAGIGSTPGLRPPADGLIGAIAPGTTVVAVDVPSGLDADSGTLPPTWVCADVVVTFTAPKRCLVEPPAADLVGRVVVADVGIELSAR